MTTSHTRSGDAAISIEAVTLLISGRPAARRAPILPARGRRPSRSCGAARRVAPRRGPRAASRSPCSPSISGSTSSGLLGRDRGGQAAGQPGHAHAQPQRRAPDEHRLGDALEHLAVAQHVRPADLEHLPRDRALRRGSQHRDHVALVDRLRAEALPGGQRQNRHPLDESHQQAERARAARRSRSRRAAPASPGRLRAARARRPRGWRGGASAPLRRGGPRAPSAARARRGTRCGALRPRAQRRRSSPPRSARARRSRRCPRRAPSSGSGSRRPPRRPAPARAPRR